jgi:anti-sigma factor ChrR (cupin superfamily)
MRNNHTLFLLGAIAVAACSKAAASDALPKSSTAPTAPIPTVEASRTNQQDLQWGPAPGLPAGAEIAVLQGNPAGNEPFTIRLRFPNGYKIPPHTHPTIENVTVLSGTFLAGMGTTFVESQMQAFGRDGFASIPAQHAHYAMARGQTVIQLHAVGPFVINYVNPADAPAAR